MNISCTTTRTRTESGRCGSRGRLIGALFVFSALLFASQTSAAIAVVVSAHSDMAALSQKEIKDIFLGKSKALPNGVTAVPVNQSEKSPIYNSFNEKVLGKPSSKVLQYWARQIFSGKGKPPTTVDGDQAVIEHITTHKGGIGYIDSGAVTDQVRVLLKIE